MSARLGGGQTYINNLIENIPHNEALKVVIYAPTSLAIPESPLVTKICVDIAVKNPLFRFIWERLYLPLALRNSKADVLFCPGGTLNTRVPKNCKTITMFRNMIPFDMRVRNSIPYGFQRVRNWLLYKVMLNSMRRADLTIFISKYAQSVIEGISKVNKSVIIPHGINELFRISGSSTPNIAPDSNYILYVSRFDVYKHHYEVIQGYSNLPDQLRNKYKLVLVGEINTSQYKRCSHLIDELKLTDDVIVLGPIDYYELPSLYQNAYLNLFASSCENCPNIMLEALASGRPLASSDVMPMPEFGCDSVVYFSPFDPFSIKECLVNLLDDEELVLAYSEKAIREAAKYSWNETAKRTWGEIFKLTTSEE